MRGTEEEKSRRQVVDVVARPPNLARTHFIIIIAVNQVCYEHQQHQQHFNEPTFIFRTVPVC